VIRLLYVCAYALLAAIGFALVARPALLWVRSQALWRTEVAWDVPFGPLFAGAAATITFLAARLAGEIALRRKPRIALHLALLLTVAACFTLRQTAGNPLEIRCPGSSRPARSSR
jgi:hypothetical protein